ncbi:MAG: polysaccharide deacetylase family protein [Chlamydiia bacterium]|nr:polysaccharide deacetylase family protein [Chlamydiia bacterium]
MRIAILVWLFCGAWIGWAGENSPVKIALTFDDFPMGSSDVFECKDRVLLYRDKLNTLGIQAAFFCIGERVAADREGECLPLIAQEHYVANHSYHHTHLSAQELSDFKEEILGTEAQLQNSPLFRRWFRFPYLDYGDRSSLGGTNRKRCAAFAFLRESGYRHGYVTMNTFDWYIDGQFKKALKGGKSVHWERLRSLYLSLLEEWMETYHQRWSGVLKRDFVHVLLLHQNDLNILFLEDLVALIEAKGWKIVSPEQAFEKPIPYLAGFANTQVRLFKGVKSLSTAYIDERLLQEAVFY